MEIRNEISSNATVVCTVDAYAKRCAEEPSWRGGRVELTIFSGSPQNPWEEEHELHLEGTLENVKNALNAALSSIERLEHDEREQVKEQAENSIRCSFCGTYYDKRLPPEWGHPSGSGGLCAGDDGILLAEQSVWLRNGAQTWRPEFPFKELKAGQQFTLSLYEDEPVFEALKNAHKHFDGHRTTWRVAVRQPTPTE